MTIFEPCCEYPNVGTYPHNTTEECDLEMAQMDGRKCQRPEDHHPFHRNINLHRGEWVYVVLVERVFESDGTTTEELYVDSDQSVLQAFRTACKAVGYRPALKQIRRGLAYGFLIDGPKLTATIIPTPRYR